LTSTSENFCALIYRPSVSGARSSLAFGRGRGCWCCSRPFVFFRAAWLPGSAAFSVCLFPAVFSRFRPSVFIKSLPRGGRFPAHAPWVLDADVRHWAGFPTNKLAGKPAQDYNI
jgi:hypothetical protein